MSGARHWSAEEDRLVVTVLHRVCEITGLPPKVVVGRIEGLARGHLVPRARVPISPKADALICLAFRRVERETGRSQIAIARRAAKIIETEIAWGKRIATVL